MNFFVLFLGVLFTIFSFFTLSYISIATIIGPWIAPTIVILSFTISQIIRKISHKSLSVQDLVKIQAISAGGGIIATGIGFSLPTLYFLDPYIFNQWMAHPVHFSLLTATICIIGGMLGLIIGKNLSKTFIQKNALPFPVSQLTLQVATATDQSSKAKTLFGGVLSTLVLLILRDGLGKWKGFIPQNIPLFPSFFKTDLTISIWPTLWAIGYLTGFQTLIPILIGLASKYVILYPLNNHAKFLPFELFQPYTPLQFSFAFCSGILLYEVFHSIPKFNQIIPKLRSLLFKTKNDLFKPCLRLIRHKINVQSNSSVILNIISYIEPLLTITLIFIFFKWFKFSFAAQITLIIISIIAIYQICLISGKIGLVQFGRFSTLVLLPMYLIFNLNAVQITLVCVFFNICAASASDLLFDYKTGILCNIPKTSIYKYQWIGVFTSALCSGFILWLLFSNLEIGSPALFAQRAQAKAALLQTFKFDKYIVFSGFLFGILLKYFKINATMTFGGILMPNNLIFSLLIGALISKFTKNKNSQFSNNFFVAGVFSSESLWIFIRIFTKIFV